ncbi:MAG: NHLP bacteriocin export ABC transporter permease/ATPase subunit [Magnetococcales bacterium]|nr:NHLP bacteriocin export ABC transporter permease/ATPase subunit [Magnetococcales bacterium]
MTTPLHARLDPLLTRVDGDRIQRLDLGGDTVFDLNQTGCVAIVLRGSVNLFARESVGEDESDVGRRHLLFQVEAGGLLTPLPPVPTQNGTARVILSGGLDVELLLVHDPHTLELLPPQVTVDLVERWILALTAAQNPLDLTYSERATPADGTITLNPGLRLAGPARGLFWCRVERGQAAFLGAEAEPGLRPMSAESWLEPLRDQPTSLTVESSKDLLHSDRLWEAVEGFCAIAANRLGGFLAHRIQERHRRLQSRWRQDSEQLSHGLTGLAETVRPDQPSEVVSPRRETPLVDTCRLVADALGETITLPVHTRKPDLEEIMQTSRLRSRWVLLRDDWFRRENGPLLGYTTDGTPLALLPDSKRGGYVAVDPSQGSRHIIDDTSAREIDPKALTLYRPLPHHPPSFLGVLGFTLKGSGSDALRMMILGVAVALLGLLTPVATGLLIEKIIPGSDLFQHGQLIAALVVAAFGAAGFEAAKGFAMLRLEGRADWNLQAAVFDRLLRLPAAFFRRFTSGDLADRTLGIQTIRETLSRTVTTALFAFLFSFVSLGLMFYYSWQLALIGIAIVLTVLTITALLAIKQLHYEREHIRHQGEVEGLVLQYIVGIGKLRAAGAQSRALGTWADRYRQQKARFVAAQRYANVQELFHATVPLMANLLIFIGVIWVLDSATDDMRLHALTNASPDLTGSGDGPPEPFSTGSFLAFNAAFGQFIQAMTGMTLAVTEALAVVPLYERFRPILDAEPETSPLRHPPGRLKGGISFNSVAFRYTAHGPPVLDGLSLTIEPGEMVAIVGGSGSGKSTIMRLMLGFDTPEQGEVFFDGTPLGSIDPDGLRRQIGVVLQNGRIASGSLFNNIAGSESMDHEQVMHIARQVGLAEDIAAMPMGLHTVLQEGGGTLSGGQRQRLLLAKALANRPAILLLDEATSALDNTTQAVVMESVKSLDITRVVIAHRLSTIVHADRILVVEKGRIVESGDYDTLMANNGPFAELAKRQMVSRSD